MFLYTSENSGLKAIVSVTLLYVKLVKAKFFYKLKKKKKSSLIQDQSH